MERIIRHRNFGKFMPIMTLLLLIGTIFFVSPQFEGFRQKITGFATINTTVVILQIEPEACNTTYVQGWNFVSVPCYNSDNDSISEIMGSIDGDYQSIHTYIGDSSSDPWKAYNPNLPSWVVQDLKEIDRKKGYWIYILNDTQYYYNGSTITPNLISLSKGWNMVGYPTFENNSIVSATSALVPNFDYFYLYNASDSGDHYKQYTWNGSLPSDQDLNRTIPYYGYWVYMNSPSTWVVLW